MYNACIAYAAHGKVALRFVQRTHIHGDAGIPLRNLAIVLYEHVAHVCRPADAVFVDELHEGVAQVGVWCTNIVT